MPTYALEFVEAAAAHEALAAGHIEHRAPLDKPLDVLAQHLVTVALDGGFRADELRAEVRDAYAYRDLGDDEWAWVLDFVTRGGPALTVYPEYQRVREQDGVYTVTDGTVARHHRIAIGTIVSDAAVRVQFLRGGVLGSIEESFINRLRPGDRLIFAGRTLELVRVRELTAWVRKARGSEGAIPRWVGGRMPLSNELASAIRKKLDDARKGNYHGPEMVAVKPVLALRAAWSRVPAPDELLIERLKSREGHHLFFYPFEGRLVHEGLAALWAYRLSRVAPISFTLAVNDYGLELLSPTPAPLDAALESGLLDTEKLTDELMASLNAAELAKREFREIARVAGLVFPGYPGAGKSARHLQASSGLFYDVFERYDPDNPLLTQARRQVLERQLESNRLHAALLRLGAGRVTVVETTRPTPLAFPLLVDRMRESLSSEKLADRVRRMQLSLERAVNRTVNKLTRKRRTLKQTREDAQYRANGTDAGQSTKA